MTVPIAPGAGVALVTLFDGDGALLPGPTGELAARIAAAGAASVLVGGTTGEYYALSDAERVSLFASVRAAVPAPVPVIGHVGGVPADRAAVLAREAAVAGLTALLALPPAGTDLRAYYETVADAAHLPVLAYHLPQAGAVIPLADLPGLPVSGIKDSSGDAGRLTMEVFMLEAEVYTGSTALLGLAGTSGPAGRSRAWPTPGRSCARRLWPATGAPSVRWPGSACARRATSPAG
jgi:4-hydroxy-tetrahydrodipicolinate synthase